MKFNVGDKAIKLDLDLFDNPFHYKKSITEVTITCADERLFSPYYEQKDIDKAQWGCNDALFFNQEHGGARWGGSQLYHKEKDAEKINALIGAAIEKYNAKCAEIDKQRMAYLVDLISDAQEEIKQINAGNGSWKVGFSRYNNKEFIAKSIAEIEKVFKLNTPAQ